MASIEVPAAKTVKCSEGEASSIPSVPAREPQHNQPTTPSAPSDGTDEIGQQALADPPKSLFGPFPTTTVASNIEQKAAVSAESGYTPVSPPGTRTNPFQPPLENIENGHQASPLRFDFNPGERESLRTNQTNQPASPRSPTLPPLTREKTAPAIGPATDKPTPFPKEVELEGPVLYITLLLSSTGARHPFRLDEKYLRKRNVTVEGNNPFNISLYKLKELILRDWREGECLFG